MLLRRTATATLLNNSNARHPTAGKPPSLQASSLQSSLVVLSSSLPEPSLSFVAPDEPETMLSATALRQMPLAVRPTSRHALEVVTAISHPFKRCVGGFFIS
jgi:hypothetical protein